MVKYSFCVEGRTLGELIHNIKNELLILEKSEERAIEFDRKMSHRITPTMRKHRAWTEYDLEFLTTNYKDKDIKWIASALQRPINLVYSKLSSLYKKGLPPLKKMNSKVKITKL